MLVRDFVLCARCSCCFVCEAELCVRLRIVVCDFVFLFCCCAICLNTSIDLVLYDVVVRDFLKYNDVCLVCFVLFVFVCAYAL